MTAYAMQGDRDKCLSAGMDAYLAKPARPQEIIAILSQFIPDGGGEPLPVAIPVEAPQPQQEEESLPVFDRDELLERLGGREEMLGRFIGMFNENVTCYLELLTKAIENGDTEQVRIQAHTIKGASANISARRVRHTSSIIEQHAREGRLTEAAGQLQLLESELEAFRLQVAG